ncbi:MAG: hypothetical protein GY858_09735 [Candidatus Omnitrophica bacterium]|nr:hypothetical protein [Candidatus Omnitrophota bacterium]
MKPQISQMLLITVTTLKSLNRYIKVSIQCALMQPLPVEKNNYKEARKTGEKQQNKPFLVEKKLLPQRGYIS